MPETEEERRKRLEQAGSMIGVSQRPLVLGGAAIPTFPENVFGGINPTEKQSPIRFGAGGTATMGLGGANVGYAPSFSLSGGAYGQREMGARDFGAARLPQTTAGLGASSIEFDKPISFMDNRSRYNEKFPDEQFSPMQAAVQGWTPAGAQPQATAIPLGSGNLTMNITQPRSFEDPQGKIPIQTPRGMMYATSDQAQNVMTPRMAGQQSSRSPAEQQALLAQMRQKGATLGQERVANMEEFFKQKRAEQTALRQATSEAALAGMDPMQVRQARAAYNERQPTSIAGIQQQYQEMLPTFNQPMEERIKSVRAPFGFPSGGPQPAQRSQAASSFWNTVSGAMPSMTAPINFPTPATPAGGIFSETQFASRLGQQEEVPFGGLSAALGPIQLRRRSSPLPIGLRGLRA